jgi:hypothetical protein
MHEHSWPAPSLGKSTCADFLVCTAIAPAPALPLYGNGHPRFSPQFGIGGVSDFVCDGHSGVGF